MSAHFEKFLSRKELYKGRVFTATLDTVELENGKQSTREVAHHNGGASVIALTDDGEIYMVRQFRYPFGKEILELPAGKLEPGEDPFLAAQRELEEECGVRAAHYTSLGEFYPTVGYCTETIYIWAATGLQSVPMHLDEDEFLTPEKIPLDTAYHMVLDGEIADGKTVAGILKLKAFLTEGKL